MKLGILAAMPQEIDLLIGALEAPQVERVGLRSYHLGRLHGVDCVLVHSRIGKVAAASTATQLIDRFRVDAVLFTGLAGGVGSEVRRGDIVVGTQLIQHDLSAYPLFPRFQVPLLGVDRFATDPSMTDRLLESARKLLGAGASRVHAGLIATGDQFITSRDAVLALRAELPDALCVEMEGAAVAQICHEHGVPFGIVRTISDSADEGASQDFSEFLENVAGPYAIGVMAGFLSGSTQKP